MSITGVATPDSLALFRTKASVSAIYGVGIAVTSVIIATVAASAVPNGEISLHGIAQIQRNNIALWVLDLMPFVYAFWGQYVTRAVTHQADAVVRDRTSELQQQAAVLQNEIRQIACRDGLTGLFNRRQIRDHLNDLIRSSEQQSALAFIVFDLEGFAEINNALGHNKGDQILKLVTGRLQKKFSSSAMIARLSGDQFAILVSGIKKARLVESVAGQIQSILSAPFKLDDIGFHLRARIGAAIFPRHGRDAPTIMQNADIAVNASKQNKVKLTLYTPRLNRQIHDRLMLKTDFYKALERDEFRLHYQPKINSANQVTEAEALVRWAHPDKGFIAPDKFIPFVEKSGLNQELLCWVLENALNQVRDWQSSGLRIGVAVNLSALDLLDNDLPVTIRRLLEQSRISSRLLKLEITETTSLIDQARALKVLNRISEMGIPISLDDFGTGYSSLTYLTRLPAQEVKIDKSFVLNMEHDQHNEEIVRAMIDLAHNLSMKVVAEGVDSEVTKQRLLSFGCDMLQGYHISKPLDADSFGHWLENWIKLTTHAPGCVH